MAAGSKSHVRTCDSHVFPQYQIHLSSFHSSNLFSRNFTWMKKLSSESKKNDKIFNVRILHLAYSEERTSDIKIHKAGVVEIVLDFMKRKFRSQDGNFPNFST